jgi:GNAT superfamily N-acetyltransferase
MSDEIPQSEPHRNSQWRYRETLRTGEQIVIQTSTTFPFDSAEISRQALEQLTMVDPSRSVFVSANTMEQQPLGFTVIEQGLQGTADFMYRYVYPNARQKGIGGVLRRETYEWGQANGISKMASGINKVFKINKDNTDVIKDATQDGTYISYLTMARGTMRDGRYPTHKITSVTVDRSGGVSLAFDTILLDEGQQPIRSERPTLPEDLNELMALIQKEVIPDGIQLSDIRNKVEKDGSITFANKQEVIKISSYEWNNKKQI